MYFQVMITISVQIAIAGRRASPVASAPSPIFSSRPLSAPLDWSMRLQPMPTTTSEMTYGTKMSTRMTDWSRILRFSSSASPRAIGPCSTSDITTMKTLWPERLVEGRVGEDDDVVAQPDEVDGRSVALPAEEAVVRRHDDGEDHEGDEDDQGRSDQDRDLEPRAPPGAAGAPAGGAPADGRRPDGGSV